jgi:hypothetical protein
MQNKVHQIQSATTSSLLNFSVVEVELMLEIARHWMKLKVNHEIDNDLIVGWFFLDTWNPRLTIQKIEKSGRTGKTGLSGWAVMPLRLAENFDISAMGADQLSKTELALLSGMMTAAATCGLKRYLMDGKTLGEIPSVRKSTSYAKKSAVQHIAEKLELAVYEIEEEKSRKFEAANYA